VALEKIAADVDALVAGDAAQRLEQAVSVLLFGDKALSSPASQRSNRLPGVRSERSKTAMASRTFAVSGPRP
jgi:hypothetical protein